MAQIAEPQLSFRDYIIERPNPPIGPFDLPATDNTPDALRSLLSANAHFRNVPWDPPFDKTTHELRIGDARDLSWIANESVWSAPIFWSRS